MQVDTRAAQCPRARPRDLTESCVRGGGHFRTFVATSSIVDNPVSIARRARFPP